MGIIKYTNALLLMALFLIAIGFFAANFAYDNDAAYGVENDTDLVAARQAQLLNIDEFYADVNESGGVYMESTLEAGDEVTASGKQAKVTAGSSLGMVTDSISVAFKTIFGGNKTLGFVLTGLISALAFMLFWYGYKAWIGRNPD